MRQRWRTQLRPRLGPRSQATPRAQQSCDPVMRPWKLQWAIWSRPSTRPDDENPSTAGAPLDPQAPTVHQKFLELKRAKVTAAQLQAESSALSTKAQASLAKTTAIQQETALEETQEKSVKHERLAYDL